MTTRPMPSTSPAARTGTLRPRRIQAKTVIETLRAVPVAALPEGSLHLHTSHLRLDKPERFDWLYTRTDVRPVFFVHDLIPITHPEYGRPRRSGPPVPFESNWKDRLGRGNRRSAGG